MMRAVHGGRPRLPLCTSYLYKHLYVAQSLTPGHSTCNADLNVQLSPEFPDNVLGAQRQSSCAILHESPTGTMPARGTDRYHACMSHRQLPYLYESPTGTIPLRVTNRYHACTSHRQVPCLCDSPSRIMHVRVTNMYPTCTNHPQVPYLYESSTGTLPV